MTEAEICNIALARVGERQFIDSLAEDSAPAQVCAALWENARDSVLAALPWPFATRRASPAVLTGVERSGWGYAYAMPADAVAVQSIYAGSRNPVSSARITFGTEYDATSGRIIVTDQEEPELLYTAKITNTALFPPLFSDALAWRLAADLALALPVKPGLAPSMWAAYEKSLARAATSEFRQSQADVQAESEFITVR